MTSNQAVSGATAPQAYTAPGGSAQIAVNVDFMQDYRRVSPATVRSGFVAIPTSDGASELYTLDQAGHVWRITPDATSETGWSAADLQFPGIATAPGVAIALAARMNTDGSVYVYAAAPNCNTTTTEVFLWSSTTGTWQDYDDEVVNRLRTCSVPNWYVYIEIGYLKWVGNAYRMMGTATSYGLSSPSSVDSYWPASQTMVDHCVGLVHDGEWNIVPGGFCLETHSGYAGIYYMAMTGEMGEYGPGADGNYSSVVTTFNSSSGYSELFALGTDGVVYHIAASDATRTYTPTPIAIDPNGMPVDWVATGIAAATDAAGVMHVLAIAANGCLYHIRQNASAPTGWEPAMPIDAASVGLCGIEAVTTVDGQIALFALANDGSVQQGTLDPDSNTWNIATLKLDVPTQDTIQQVASYTAVLTAYSAGGSLAVGSSIAIACLDSDAVATLQIDGSTVLVDNAHPWQGFVGPDGQVVVGYETTALAAPVLAVLLDGMNPTDRVLVDLSGAVRATANAGVVNGATLLQQPTAFGEKLNYSQSILLQGVDDSDASQLATTLGQVMELAQAPGAATGPALHPSSKPHVARYLSNWVTARNPATWAQRAVHFHLDLSGKIPVSRTLEPDDAQALMTKARQAGSPVAGLFGWIESVGDVLDAVVDGIMTVYDVVVSGASAVLQVIVEGVTYFLDVVGSGIEQALDLLEVVFDKVAVGFSQLLGWLGWIFNWSDILRTHQLLVYMTQYGMAVSKVGVQSAQTQVASGITQMQGAITDAINDYIAQLTPSQTFGGAISSMPAVPSAADAATDPRNVFSRAARSNANDATLSAPGQSKPDEVQPSQFTQQMQPFATSLAASPQMTALANAVSPASGSASLMEQSVASVLPLIRDGAVAGLGLIQGASSSVFQTAISGVDNLNDMLTAEWNVPLVSDLYAWITGEDSSLCALDLACLLLAIPVTVGYKAVFGVSPAADGAAVTAIEAAYPMPGSSVVASSPEVSPKATAAKAAGDSPSPTPLQIGAQLATFTLGLSYITYAVIESRVDFGIGLWSNGPQLPQGAWANEWWVVKPGAMWKVLLVGNEAITWFLTAATTIGPNLTSWDCGTASGMSNWICSVAALFPIFDAICLAGGTLVRELWNNTGALLNTAWGVIGSAMQIIVWTRLGSQEWLKSLAGLLAFVPQLVKYGLSPEANIATDGLPAGAVFVAACDGLFNLAAGLFWVWSATPSAVQGLLPHPDGDAQAARA